jgi:hypothetical protein
LRERKRETGGEGEQTESVSEKERCKLLILTERVKPSIQSMNDKIITIKRVI